jgi:hypothetical protein
MEGEGHHGVVLACSICGFLFAVLSPFSFWVLWAVNWRPWRLYRYAAEVLYLSLSGSTNILLFFVVCYLVCILSVLTKTACLFFVQLTTINKAGNPFFVFVLGILDLCFLYLFVHFCKVYIYNHILLVS